MLANEASLDGRGCLHVVPAWPASARSKQISR
jgi:hypothetical protein